MKSFFSIVALLISYHSYGQPPTYPRPLALDPNNYSESDTAYYYLSAYFEVKIVFSKGAKIKDIIFNGVEELNKVERIYRGGRIISYKNQEGIMMGPEVMINKKNRLTVISCNKNGNLHCWSYLYYKKTNKLRQINLYENGVMQPCKLVFDDRGDLFIDTCDLLKGIRPCQ
jgi:hypothetical protein